MQRMGLILIYQRQPYWEGRPTTSSSRLGRTRLTSKHSVRSSRMKMGHTGSSEDARPLLRLHRCPYLGYLLFCVIPKLEFVCVRTLQPSVVFLQSSQGAHQKRVVYIANFKTQTKWLEITWQARWCNSTIPNAPSSFFFKRRCLDMHQSQARSLQTDTSEKWTICPSLINLHKKNSPFPIQLFRGLHSNQLVTIFYNNLKLQVKQIKQYSLMGSCLTRAPYHYIIL